MATRNMHQIPVTNIRTDVTVTFSCNTEQSEQVAVAAGIHAVFLWYGAIFADSDG